VHHITRDAPLRHWPIIGSADNRRLAIGGLSADTD